MGSMRVGHEKCIKSVRAGYSQLVRQPTGPSQLVRRNYGLELGLEPLIMLNVTIECMIIG